MTIAIRCARSIEEFAAVETAPEYIADTERYLQRLFETDCSRLDWCFIAETATGARARLALWALSGTGKPLDFVLFNTDWRATHGEDANPALALLQHLEAFFRASGFAAIGHCQDIPPREPQWQTDRDAREQLLKRAGFQVARHTLRYRLHGDTFQTDGSADALTGLELVPVTDSGSDLLLSLVAQVASVSHDQLDRDGCAEQGANEHARLLIEDLREMRVDADWWQFAYERDAAGKRGTLVGFVLPTATADMGSIGYVGVLPSHRGKNFVDPLLHYASRKLGEAKFPRIVADTDFSNVPMSRAFERNGWVQFGERLEWSKRL
jgi:ribosomal protein S18 acetylase RimI-like enzyme